MAKNRIADFKSTIKGFKERRRRFLVIFQKSMKIDLNCFGSLELQVGASNLSDLHNVLR